MTILILKLTSRFSQRIFWLLITTPSEYISDQLNNHIRLNNVSDEKLEKLKLHPSDILKCDDVAIYNFRKTADYQFNSERLDIDKTGFYEDNFSQIVDELYEETVEIINSSIYT